MDSENLLICIENCAARITKMNCYETVLTVLEKYGAHSIEDLRPSQYAAVFDELDAKEADLNS
ncbi:MAG: hypothetical protein IKQ27_15995 [Lachnospiraceae bacterium]|nr:hypothetical protein [Lachnospiraceae bacterium]